ncbi:MAG: aminotransferase class V-fold PLP-dependent enzyme [Chloroflexota bacterium]
MKTVDEVRKDIPVLSKYIFLNAGTLSPAPEPVTQAFFKAYQDWHSLGAGLPQHYVYMRDDMMEQVRHKLADFVHCDADEIAFTANCTEGVDIVANGIDWQPGDEVIITDKEHPANSNIWMHLRTRRGIRVRIVAMTTDNDELLARVRAALSPRTRLIAVSHVCTMNGQILPVEQICRLAAEHGALSLLDGAHAVGQMPVDVRAIGCDFYAMNGHKWLMGPAGTGALYLKRSKLDQIVPSWVGDVAGGSIDYREEGSYTLAPGAKRFEFATRCWPLYAGLAAAIDYVNDIGIETIRARIRKLTDDFKRDLLAIPGMRLWSPEDPDASVGLVSFEIAGWVGEDLVHRLDALNIRPRWLDNGIRVSIGYYTLAEELKALSDALNRIVTGS